MSLKRKSLLAALAFILPATALVAAPASAATPAVPQHKVVHHSVHKVTTHHVVHKATTHHVVHASSTHHVVHKASTHHVVPAKATHPSS